MVMEKEEAKQREAKKKMTTEQKVMKAKVEIKGELDSLISKMRNANFK